MKDFCARTCGFCDVDHDALALVNVSLNGVDATLVQSPGVRAMRFFQLPVSEDQGEMCMHSGHPGKVDAACEFGRRVHMRTHMAAAVFYDGQKHALESPLYRWNVESFSFVEHLRLPTLAAWDLDALEVEGKWYLVIASFFDGHSRRLNSTVWRWDMSKDTFVHHQDILTDGAMDVEALAVSDKAALIAFTGNSGAHASQDSCQLLRWRQGYFEAFQTLPVSGGYDAEAFVGQDGDDDFVYLVLVHEMGTDVFRAPTSAIHAFGPVGNAFALAQRLEVSHGRDAEYFVFGRAKYLALAVFRAETSYQTFSRIYEFQSRPLDGIIFKETNRFPTQGAFDVEFFQVHGRSPLLLVANQRSGVLTLYSVDHERDQSYTEAQAGLTLVERSSLSTSRVYDVAWSQIPEAEDHIYLGVARFGA